ncbi:DUF2087 domain-containing protein [Paracoccus tegillarcae]|uniref:DUF2087 domain-containing protein n=1 Tax=Paracoccus tegillarcae TaxID=1529068 RepID=A0A2K9EX07_9RHOB|nr:DUF2087 domain-containing protein [Paracoccus tegillarcae]AUH35496.1 hypothetical protein CUV01_15260 [Paracoccus tegillarcae]
MSRDLNALYIADLSAFARTLRDDLTGQGANPPGHQVMLGLIARAAGFRNYQQLRADASPPALSKAVARALRYFDDQGRLTSWPAQTRLQALCLWRFWAGLLPGRDYREAEISDALKDWHLFGDHVLLRRSLIDHRLMTRATDGSWYRRVEQAPPPEALAMIRADLRSRVT